MELIKGDDMLLDLKWKWMGMDGGIQEAYYDMLVKYREELTRPLQEAMEFMRRVETQLNMLTNAPLRIFNSPGTLSLFIFLIQTLLIIELPFNL